MSTFVLIPGAGGVSWYWHRILPRLEDAGHEAIAVDLPGDDETAGLAEYTNRVLDAIGERDDVVLVAQSLGAFTAPLVAAKVPVRAVILVNAMIPAPAETPDAWWDNTGSRPTREAAAERGGYSTEFDLAVYFLHDVPPEVACCSGGYSASARRSAAAASRTYMLASTSARSSSSAAIGAGPSRRTSASGDSAASEFIRSSASSGPAFQKDRSAGGGAGVSGGSARVVRFELPRRARRPLSSSSSVRPRHVKIRNGSESKRSASR